MVRVIWSSCCWLVRMSRRATESIPPDTATPIWSHGSIMEYRRMVPITLERMWGTGLRGISGGLGDELLELLSGDDLFLQEDPGHLVQYRLLFPEDLPGALVGLIHDPLDLRVYLTGGLFAVFRSGRESRGLGREGRAAPPKRRHAHRLLLLSSL